MIRKIAFLLLLLSMLLFSGNYILKNQGDKNNVSDDFKTNIALETPQIKNNPSLSKFYLLTREDPLFTSPDFDPEAFQKAVDELELEEKAYISFLDKTEKLFPLSFLKDVVEVAKLTKAFISNPEVKSADKLIIAYKKALNNYEKERNSLLKYLDSNQISKGSYVGINTSTSKDVVIDDFKKLGENFKQLQNEIAERENCLNNGADCKRSAAIFKEPELKEETFRFSKEDILPLDMLTISSMASPSVYGPYIASTPCFGKIGGLNGEFYLFYVLRGKERRSFIQYPEKLNTQTQKILTTNYYRKLKKEQGGVDEYFSKKGFERIRYYETNIYTCSDATYKGKLASLNKLYQTYKNDLIFEKLLKLKDLSGEQKKIFSKGDLLEKKFFKSEFPSEYDADNLTNYYAYLYKNIVLWGNDKELTEKEWFKTAFEMRFTPLDRYLDYSRRLSNIDEVVADSAGHFSSLRLKSLLGDKDSSFYAYSFRNMYGLLYFPFSPSFYRLQSPLSYFSDKPVSPPEIPYVSYQELLKQYSEKEIKRWNSIDITSYLEEEFKKFQEKGNSSSGKLKKASAANE